MAFFRSLRSMKYRVLAVRCARYLFANSIMLLKEDKRAPHKGQWNGMDTSQVESNENGQASTWKVERNRTSAREKKIRWERRTY